jgi:lipopolysaccharide export system protein LptA
MVKLFFLEKLNLSLIIKTFYLFFFVIFFSNSNSESYVKAGESLIWDSENQSYTANGSVEFKNDEFVAFADKMIANYIKQDNDEIFTIVELFENVVIEFKDEIFRGNYAIYTRDDNIIKLTGNVSIESPTRLLKGNELIADIDNNKRILNSANKESLVEVLLENNADD